MSNLNILDLPNEILLIIFEKLNTIDVLYSLVDVNRRFERLVFGSLPIHDLDMTHMTTINSISDQTLPVDTQFFSRICEQILPRIRHQIHQLTVEQSSMKQILLAASYPQLYSLSLQNFQEKTLHQHLRDDLILRNLLTKQIRYLNIGIQETTEQSSEVDAENVALILTLCPKLTVLKFNDIFPTREYWTSICPRASSCMSSTLIKLKINVEHFSDCLYLLDGRLDCLSTLIVNVQRVNNPGQDIGERRTLTKLKSFSLIIISPIFRYDYHLVVPLLRRMINLEELNLSLSVMSFEPSYIDGIELYDQFLINMTQLKKFRFNILTTLYNINIAVELPSNEDIQHTFISGRGYEQVASYIRIFSTNVICNCHIYSLPFAFDYFTDLDSSFPGGRFDQVRCLKMCDSEPFEWKFFQVISQDFPVLQFLYVYNKTPQKHKQDPSISIIFPYLIYLDLQGAHDDYAEQFLLKENVHLPRLLNLYIECQSLITITNNFTKDARQFNFCLLKSIDVCQPLVRPENFHRYFPLL